MHQSRGIWEDVTNAPPESRKGLRQPHSQLRPEVLERRGLRSMSISVHAPRPASSLRQQPQRFLQRHHRRDSRLHSPQNQASALRRRGFPAHPPAPQSQSPRGSMLGVSMAIGTEQPRAKRRDLERSSLAKSKEEEAQKNTDEATYKSPPILPLPPYTRIHPPTTVRCGCSGGWRGAAVCTYRECAAARLAICVSVGLRHGYNQSVLGPGQKATK
jgi:hypothetical protein